MTQTKTFYSIINLCGWGKSKEIKSFEKQKTLPGGPTEGEFLRKAGVSFEKSSAQITPPPDAHVGLKGLLRKGCSKTPPVGGEAVQTPQRKREKFKGPRKDILVRFFWRWGSKIFLDLNNPHLLRPCFCR